MELHLLHSADPLRSPPDAKYPSADGGQGVLSNIGQEISDLTFGLKVSKHSFDLAGLSIQKICAPCTLPRQVFSLLSQPSASPHAALPVDRFMYRFRGARRAFRHTRWVCKLCSCFYLRLLEVVGLEMS